MASTMINKNYFIVLLSLGSSNMLFTCHHRITKGAIHGVHVSCMLPVINKDTIFQLKDSYEVFYENDLVLYKLKYQFDSAYNGKVVFEEQRYYYFIFERDSLFGRTYDFLTHPSDRDNQRLSVDSMLKVNTFQMTKVKMLARVKPDSVYFDTDRDLLKVYNMAPDSSSPEKFTVRFYYSKRLGDIRETFSPAMDNVPNLKLFKVDIKGNGAYYKQFNYYMPERVYRYQMDTLTPQNSEELIHYFNKYSGRG